MTWLSYIYPQTIARFSSAFNRDIRVVEEYGRYKILVSGSPQSGPYIEKIWKKALRSFGFLWQISPKSILVLGIAGGTVIHLLHKWYPSAEITAVDIDQTMIDIGKKYFGLSSIKNLTIIRADARKTIKNTYDLIIVDLSLGRNIPTFVTSKSFLLRLKRRSRMLVINFLREKEYREISDNFKKTLMEMFATVREKPIFLNRFFMVE